jgi:D-xylose transport system substrate-binding protein
MNPGHCFSICRPLVLFLSICSIVHASKEHPVIGLSIDSLEVPRWQRDRDGFVAAADKAGATVLVQSAGSNDAVQAASIKSFVARKVDVIVIVAHNAATLGAVIKDANTAGIPVVCYDRLIENADVAYYLSFDNEKIGELQAGYVAARLPVNRKARIVRIFGSPTDHNAVLYKEGQDKVLLPLIAAGRVEIIHEDWAASWDNEAAKKIMAAAIEKGGTMIDAVIASNDGLAGAAVEVLQDRTDVGKILVTGQDADLAACARIKSGTQAMTIYKPLDKLAALGAQVAVSIAQGKVPEVANLTKTNNGLEDVPTALEDVITVDKDNIDATIVAAGFHRRK